MSLDELSREIEGGMTYPQYFDRYFAGQNLKPDSELRQRMMIHIQRVSIYLGFSSVRS